MAGNFDRKLRLPRIHFRVVSHAEKCDTGQTALLPFRRKACWGFFRSEKPELANLGTKGQYATSRSPKPLYYGHGIMCDLKTVKLSLIWYFCRMYNDSNAKIFFSFLFHGFNCRYTRENNMKIDTKERHIYVWLCVPICKHSWLRDVLCKSTITNVETLRKPEVESHIFI